MLGPKQYLLTSDSGFEARGEVGQLLSKAGVTMMVGAIRASTDSEFTVTKFSTLGMINNLQNNLTVTETGKDTGVLSLSFTGEDRDQIRAILDSITRNYRRRMWSANRKKPLKALVFLDKQLPEVRQNPRHCGKQTQRLSPATGLR